MKKRNYVVAAASALALALTACGGGNTKEETIQAQQSAEETVTEEETEEKGGADKDTADKNSGSEEEEAGDKGTEEAESSSEKEDAEITEADIAEFAEEVEGIVMNKNVADLAEVVDYPVYVASITENEGVVPDKEAFMAIGKDGLFTEAFVDAVTSFDVTGLESSEAGYVIGEGTLNVTFHVNEDGDLRITGINNK